MRRIALRTGRTALFLAMVAIVLAATLPMRLALAWFGLADEGLVARRVTGSIWSGRLVEARFGEVALGDLRASLAPLPLLAGRARIALAGEAEAPRIKGAVVLARHRLGIEDVTASIPVGRAFAPLPITALDLADVSVVFRDGACERAEGRVVATLAAGAIAASSMSGALRCEGGALLVPLAGRSGLDVADLRLWQDGRFRAALTLADADPAQAAALQQAGFVAAGGTWRLAIEGRF